MLKAKVTQPNAALIAVFERFITPINARALARSVLHHAGADASNATIYRQLEASASVYVKVDVRSALLAAARQHLLGDEPSGRFVRTPELVNGGPLSSASSASSASASIDLSVSIRRESDLNEARLIARQMCQQVGLDGFAAQKLVTAVSELARNVAKYASPGRVMFVNESDKRKLRVTVSDSGTGIPNLDEVLKGKYRSKTGMGLGLIGTKKLVDEFDIQTSATGTTITIAVRY